MIYPSKAKNLMIQNNIKCLVAFLLYYRKLIRFNKIVSDSNTIEMSILWELHAFNVPRILLSSINLRKLYYYNFPVTHLNECIS